MAEFDIVSKQRVQTHPDDFVWFSLGQDDVEIIGAINTDLPTVEAHHADIFIHVRIGGEEAFELPMRGSAKVNYLTDLAILSGLVYESQTIFDIISEATMYESSIVQHFTERGIAQGIEKGIQESIQEVLEIRFDSHAVQSTAARIETIGDLQRLKRLHREAIKVSSFEEFRRLLDAT